MRVKEIMNERHPFIYENELATKARAIIREFTSRILPLVSENRRLGVVSRGNVMTFSCSVMKASVIAVKSHTRVSEAAELMISRGVGRIPLKDDKGKLVGIIDREDVARLLV